MKRLALAVAVLAYWPAAADDNPFKRELERRERVAQILCTDAFVSFWRREGEHWQSETLRIEEINRLSLYDDGESQYYPVLYTSFGWYQLDLGSHVAMRDCLTGASWWERMLDRFRE